MNLIKNKSLINNLVHKSTRLCHSDSSKGIKYHKFTYYPRDPDFKDPPYEPSKLLMVKRIKPFWGNRKHEKRILEHLKLDGKMQDVAIVKNSPENNARLWRIKHLIEITPVTFPDGEPTAEDAETLGVTFVNEFGELSINKKLNCVNVTQISEDMTKPNRDTIKRHLRLKWTTGMLD